MQPTVGYPPGGNANLTRQGENYQVVQLTDNSFNKEGQYPAGMMPQVEYPPGIVEQGMDPKLIAMMNETEMKVYNEVMKTKSMKGMQRLEEAKGVFIKQSFIFQEALRTGCCGDSPNVFRIFEADSNGKKIGTKPILQCKDQSDYCPRFWCGPDCLPMQMKVSKEIVLLNSKNIDTTQFLFLIRPCQCAFLCADRRVMNIMLLEDGQIKLLGKVRSPSSLKSIVIQIDDGDGYLKYTIEGSLCQMGYICSPFCCDPCFKFDLEVKDASDQVIAHVLKKTPGLCKSNQSTNLEFGFPERATAEEKALLVGGILMIDFLHFENQKKFLCSYR